MKPRAGQWNKNAVVGEEDYGVRFYGIPSGYEFASLLHAIKLVASAEPALDQTTIAFLDTLTEPAHIQVFVTPTCPYCQTSVMLGHKMAVASPMVRAARSDEKCVAPDR